MNIPRGETSIGKKLRFKQTTSPRVVSMVILLVLAAFIACIPLSSCISRIGISQQNEDLSAFGSSVYRFGMIGIVLSLIVFVISLKKPRGKMHFPCPEIDLKTATSNFNHLFQKYIGFRPDQWQIIKNFMNKSRLWGSLSLLSFAIGGLIYLYLHDNNFAMGMAIPGLVFLGLWASTEKIKVQKMTYLWENRNKFYEDLRNLGFRFSIKPGSLMYPEHGVQIKKFPDNSHGLDTEEIVAFFSAARAMGYFYQNNKSEIFLIVLFLLMPFVALSYIGETGAGMVSLFAWGIISAFFGVLLVIFGLRQYRQGWIVIKVKLSLKMALSMQPAFEFSDEDFVDVEDI